MSMYRKASKNLPHKLDDKLAYDLWRSAGTLAKAQSTLAEMGILSPLTERVYSTTAISCAAWRYALDNEDIARRDMEQEYRAEGLELDEEFFQLQLVKYAMYTYSPTNFRRWVRDTNREKYIDEAVRTSLRRLQTTRI